MVRPRNVGRSRGCQPCRKRRIKCDLKSPCCERCIESNRVCPGPETGLIVMNSSNTAYLSSGRFKKRKLSSERYAKESASSSDSPVSYSGTERLSPSDRLDHHSIQIYNTPDPAATYDEALLWKFMTFFSENVGRRTWLSRLPTHIKSGDAPALQTAARAVSLVYASQVLNNPSIKAAAYEYYGKSLHYHRRALVAIGGVSETTSSKGPRSIIVRQAVPVTVLLSYFEMISAISSHTWLEHTFAAEKLLFLLGPEAMQQDEFLNHLYFMIRSHATIRNSLYGSDSTFSQHPSWSSVPNISPCSHTWHLHNDISDLIVNLCRALPSRCRHSPPPPLSFTPEFLTGCLQELEDMWTSFSQACGFNVDQYPLLPPPTQQHRVAAAVASDSHRPAYNQDIHSKALDEKPYDILLPPELQTTSNALTASYIHAGVILASSLLVESRTSSSSSSSAAAAMCTTLPPPSPPFPTVSISHHSEQILTLTQVLRNHHIGCALARMLLPLNIVYRFDPLESTRRAARMLYSDWCRQDGLNGLIDVAFPTQQQ